MSPLGLMFAVLTYVLATQLNDPLLQGIFAFVMTLISLRLFAPTAKEKK